MEGTQRFNLESKMGRVLKLKNQSGLLLRHSAMGSRLFQM